MSAAPLRIGVLGAARVAGYALIAPARRSARACVTAVAARDPEQARRHAAEHGIARALPDYEALITDADVDAVYIALPAALHAPWTLRALDAGKHVLCEKPFASNAREAARMVATAEARGRVLVEAHHWRFHPLADRLRAVVTSGAIGAVRRIDAGFTADIAPGDIRYDLALGGGALMDLGCYPVQWARFVAGAEPTVIGARAVVGPPGVDVELTADMMFPGGTEARIYTSMAPTAARETWLSIQGDAGEIHVDNPLHPHSGHRLTIRTTAGTRAETVPGRTTYEHQLEVFAAAVLDGVPAQTGGEDAVATMRAIDAIYRAAGLAPRGS
ncbi:putative oxidoreductase [Minicystis rosea]|nr:putative oxidoreductase [Minicystis rosea]